MTTSATRATLHRALGLLIAVCVLVQPLVLGAHLTFGHHSHGGHEHPEGSPDGHGCGDHGHHHSHGDQSGHRLLGLDGEGHEPHHPAEDHFGEDAEDTLLADQAGGQSVVVLACQRDSVRASVSPRIERAHRARHEPPPRGPAPPRAPSRAPPAIS